jgi:hypothetical protein
MSPTMKLRHSKSMVGRCVGHVSDTLMLGLMQKTKRDTPNTDTTLYFTLRARPNSKFSDLKADLLNME